MTTSTVRMCRDADCGRPHHKGTTKPIRLCEVAGCDGKHLAKGMCRACYYFHDRYGTTQRVTAAKYRRSVPLPVDELAKLRRAVRVPVNGPTSESGAA